jgi:hypothetical protein
MQVSAKKFVRGFAEIRESAANGPITVTDHNRIIGGWVSPADLAQLLAASRQEYRAEDLPDNAKKAIEPATYPTEAEITDLDQWTRTGEEKVKKKPEKLTPIQINIPPALNRQLARACFEQSCTKTYLIIKALAGDGFEVDSTYLSPDRRKPKV